MSGLLDQLLATPAWLALLVVFALPALESSVFLGFLFPGETAVLMGGVLASRGDLPVAAVLAAGIGGAVVGDGVGYAVGRRWGRSVLASTLGRFVRENHLARAERALLARGGWAVFLGRFTVALRVMIPGLAGMAGMPFRRFAVANLSGGVVWGAAMVTAGYLAGSGWRTVEHYVTDAGAVLVVGVVTAVVVGRVARRLVRGRGGPEAEGHQQRPGTARHRSADAGRARPGRHYVDGVARSDRYAGPWWEEGEGDEGPGGRGRSPAGRPARGVTLRGRVGGRRGARRPLRLRPALDRCGVRRGAA